LASAASDAFPIHLPLGEDALAAIQRDIEAWRDVLNSTAFPEMNTQG
jgi:hypothetical protein